MSDSGAQADGAAHSHSSSHHNSSSHDTGAPIAERPDEPMQQDDTSVAAGTASVAAMDAARAADAVAPPSSLRLYDPSASPPLGATNGATAAAPVAPPPPQSHSAQHAAAPSGGACVPAPSSLSSPFESDVWLLLLHRLYHSPAPWARDMARSMFRQLQHDADEQPALAQAATNGSALQLSASDWTGATRPLSLDELMARQMAASFPSDYMAQLLRDLLASKTRDAAAAAHAPVREHRAAESAASSSTAATAAVASGSGAALHASPSKLKLKIKPLMGGGTGYSLAASSGVTGAAAGSASLGLWERGSRALLPSMRPRLPGSASSSDVASNVATLLRTRQMGAPRRRATPTGAAVSSASAPAAAATTVYASRLRRHKIVTGHVHAIYCVAMDRTGRRAFTGSDDNTVKVWAVHSGRLIATCRGHEGEITDIGVAPDNSLVASASNDARIRVWDLNGVPLGPGVLRAHTADVQRLAFNPDWAPGKQLLVSASLDGTACVWDCANLAGAPQVITTKPRPWPIGVPYVPYDLELLARQGSEVEPAYAGLGMGSSLATHSPSIANPEFLCVSFHPSGSELVCGHNDHRARVYDVKRRTLLAVLSGHRGEVESAVYSNDGARVLTLASDGEAIVWARVEWDEIREAAVIVKTELPTQPPLPPQNIWAHDASTPLAQASFYAGLRRALPAAPASAAAAGGSTAGTSRIAPSLSPSPPPAAAVLSSAASDSAPRDLPTHRYIIVARLVVALPSSPAAVAAASAAAAATSAAAASAGGSGGGAASAASSSSSSLKVSSAIWSLHDDCIYGASASHGVLVWRLPAPVCDAEGRLRLERVDPHMAQHLEHSRALAANAAARSAAAGAGTGGKHAERATGRSKRSLALGQSASGAGSGIGGSGVTPAPAPLNFLSCFARRTLAPSLAFPVHTEEVRVLQRHPTLPDLLVSAGTDGRVVLYDVAQRRVLRVLRESVAADSVAAADGLVSLSMAPSARSPSNFVDGAFSPACTGGASLLLTTEAGQIYFCGVGMDPHAYLVAPQQQFFVRDYLAVQRDQYDNVLDVDSQCPPHLAPSATTLCDLNLHVYPLQLPHVQALDLDRVLVPVSPAPPAPNRPRVRVRVYTEGSEPRYSVASVHSARTGISPPSTGPADSATAVADAAAPGEEVEVDSDVWRVASSRSRSPPFYPELSPIHMASLYRAQLSRDSEALRFTYQLRVAWQQQREVIRVANRLNAAESGVLSGGLRSGRARAGRGAVSIAPTWYPLLSLPLPPHTPLLDAQEEHLACDDDEEQGADETGLYRSCVFDSSGIARRIRLSASAVAARSARPSALEALRPPASGAGTGARSRVAGAAGRVFHAGGGGGGGSNIHTLAGTRRRPIPLDEPDHIDLDDEGDDNYRDDDFDPSGRLDAEDADIAAAGGASRNQRRNARAQGRALRRFEDLRAGASRAGAGAGAAAVAGGVVLIDADEEDAAAAAAAGAAGADASSRDHSEYSAASDSDAAGGTRGRRRGGSGASSDDSEEEEEETESSHSSDSDSDASYNARRGNGPSSSRKRKRKSSRSGGGGGSGRSKGTRSLRRSDRAAGGASQDPARRASKRARSSRREWNLTDEDEEDDEHETAQLLEADEADEEREERERRAAQRQARARKRQGGPSSSQRSAARKPARYQDADSDEDERLFVEEQGDYASRVGGAGASAGEEGDSDSGDPRERVLASGRNWLARPLTQLYNSSYSPQVLDEVVYCRVGHEQTLRNNPHLPRTNLPRPFPQAPPFVEALVVRVEYMWAADAYAGPGDNPFARLPLNAQGLVDALALQRLPAPLVFARVTLVPTRDVHLIRNIGVVGNNNRSAHPLLSSSPSPSPSSPGLSDAAMATADAVMKSEPDSSEHPDPSFFSPFAQLAQAASDMRYDFTPFASPARWFEVASLTEGRVRLRRVVRPGDNWTPRATTKTEQADGSPQTQTQAQALGEEFQMVGGRRKRTLRGIPESGAEESSASAFASSTSAAPVPSQPHLPERQSLRRATLLSMQEASASPSNGPSAPPAQAAPAEGHLKMRLPRHASSVPSASSSSGSRTRIVLRRGAGGSHTAVDPTAKEEPLSAPASAPSSASVDAAAAAAAEQLDRASRDLALTLQSQPARASARQRVPKKQDPYEAQLVSNAPQQLASTRVRGAAGSRSGGGGGAADHDAAPSLDLELPPSAFIVDLFEPTDADYLVLASRIRACPIMAPWISQSADVESWAESPSPALMSTHAASSALASTASASTSASAAPAPQAREWCAGERFRMKFVDEVGSHWSEGVILSNAMHTAAQETEREAQAHAYAGGGRISTRNQARSAAPAQIQSSMVTPWECLRVSWKSEADLAAMLEAQAAERSTQLVQPASAHPHSSAQDAAAAARLVLLASLEAEDTVSPWEIDRLDRSVSEVPDLDLWIAAMDARSENPAAAAAAAGAAAGASPSPLSASLCPSRVVRPELVHIASPDVLLDPSEHLAPECVSRLLRLIGSVQSEERYSAFAAPVQHGLFPDYMHVVPYSVDLDTIRRRLEGRYYRSVAAVAQEVRAMRVAAGLYNAPKSDIVLLAQRLERRLLRAIARAAPGDVPSCLFPEVSGDTVGAEGEGEETASAEPALEEKVRPTATAPVSASKRRQNQRGHDGYAAPAAATTGARSGRHSSAAALAAATATPASPVVPVASPAGDAADGPVTNPADSSAAAVDAAPVLALQSDAGMDERKDDSASASAAAEGTVALEPKAPALDEPAPMDIDVASEPARQQGPPQRLQQEKQPSPPPPPMPQPVKIPSPVSMPAAPTPAPAPLVKPDLAASASPQAAGPTPFVFASTPPHVAAPNSAQRQPSVSPAPSAASTPGPLSMPLPLPMSFLPPQAPFGQQAPMQMMNFAMPTFAPAAAAGFTPHYSPPAPQQQQQQQQQPNPQADLAAMIAAAAAAATAAGQH